MFIQQHNFGSDLSLRCGHVDGVHNSGDHLHQFFEIVPVFDGEIEITVDGTKYLAGAGDIAIISPFSIHSFYTPRHVKQLICVFNNSLLTDFIPLTELCKKREAAVFHASAPLWEYLINSGFYDNTHTKREFDPVKDANYIHRLRSVFYLVLAEYFNTVPAIGDSTIDYTLSKILVYISENYDKDISLETVGLALGYSPKYVSACLKAIPSVNFRSLVNSLRIERAKNLLLTTDKDNTEIAYECGFISQASFHRAFREQVGTTTGKYRANRR